MENVQLVLAYLQKSGKSSEADWSILLRTKGYSYQQLFTTGLLKKNFFQISDEKENAIFRHKVAN